MQVTLNQIKAADPCAEGWKKLLSNNPFITDNWDEKFPVTSIYHSNDLEDMIWAIENTKSDELVDVVINRIASKVAIRDNNTRFIDYLIKKRLGLPIKNYVCTYYSQLSDELYKEFHEDLFLEIKYPNLSGVIREVTEYNPVKLPISEILNIIDQVEN